MTQVWCAKHRDGWCALKTNRKPDEGANSVATKCNHFICLPWGFDKREPTCRECCPNPAVLGEL